MHIYLVIEKYMFMIHSIFKSRNNKYNKCTAKSNCPRTVNCHIEWYIREYCTWTSFKNRNKHRPSVHPKIRWRIWYGKITRSVSKVPSYINRLTVRAAKRRPYQACFKVTQCCMYYATCYMINTIAKCTSALEKTLYYPANVVTPRREVSPGVMVANCRPLPYHESWSKWGILQYTQSAGFMAHRNAYILKSLFRMNYHGKI